MLRRFESKTVIITGAGGGIGRQLALDYVNEGATVIAIDINNDSLQKLSDKSDSIIPYEVNITDNNQIEKLTDELWEKVILVNLTATMCATRKALDVMLLPLAVWKQSW